MMLVGILMVGQLLVVVIELVPKPVNWVSLLIFIADYANHCIMEWKRNVVADVVVASGNGAGNHLDQLSGPTYVITDEETNGLIINDFGNQRIMRWSRTRGTKAGEVLIQGVYSYGLVLDADRRLYVTDSNKHEVRRYRIGEKDGELIAGGNGAGNGLNQFHSPFTITIDHDYSIYVADRDNHRIMKWEKNAKQGIIVAGGQSRGGGLNQLSFLSGLHVDKFGSLYIVESNNRRVTRWRNGATQGEIIIGGVGANQLNGPIGLACDKDGNLYVADYNNHRVQRISIEKNN